jgi:hypothetical protein
MNDDPEINIGDAHNVKITQGIPTRIDYRPIHLNKMIGKTIEAVGSAEIEGSDGPEPCSIILFNDGTGAIFVHPAD